MTAVDTFGRIPALRVRDSTIFSFALLAATVVPIAFMVIANAAFPVPPSFFQPGLSALAFLGGGHVFITFWFYMDPSGRQLMGTTKWYYYALPFSIMAATCLIYTAMSVEARPYAYVAFLLSAQWHHARQNVGVYSFLSKAWGLGAVSRPEKLVLSLSFIGSIFVGLRWNNLPLVTGEMNAFLYKLGVGCFVVIFLTALFYGMREFAAHRNLRKTLLFLTLSMFFLPSILFTSPGAASSFGAAHAIQYYIFLYYVIYRTPEKVLTTVRLPSTQFGWVAAIAIAAVWPLLVLYGLSGVYMSLNAAVPNHFEGGIDTIVFGVVMGWVITHSVIDAGVWKMSDPKVRAYHRDTFAFLK
jgi:hypothetical protein